MHKILQDIKEYNPFLKSNTKALLVTTITMLILFFVLLIILRTYTESQYQKSRSITVEKLSNERAIIENRMHQLMHIPQALGAYAIANRGVDYAFFMELSKEMTDKISIFNNISLAPKNVVEFIYPMKDNESIIGFNYMEHPVQKIEVKRAIANKTTIITGPVNLIQGGKAFIIRTPIYIPNEDNPSVDNYWGMVSMLIDYKLLMQEISNKTDGDGYKYAIRSLSPDGKGLSVFYGDSLNFEQYPILQEIVLPGGDSWEIAALPIQGWDRKQYVSISIIFMFFFPTLLIGLMIFINLVNIRKLRDFIQEKEVFIRDLKKAKETQNKMYTIIAHDLRTPFNALIMTLELLSSNSNEITPEYIYNRVSDLKKSAEHFNSLSTNLLFWARSQINELKFVAEKLKLSDSIDDVILLLKSHAESKEIIIKKTLLENAVCLGDKNMISTVIRNLLSNAIKFTPEKGLIEIKMEYNNLETTVHFSNSGQGISEEVQATLFSSAYNDSSRGTGGEQGSGLGLILCKEFVEAHNGNIWVTSIPNEKTTFSFSIPNEISN